MKDKKEKKSKLEQELALARTDLSYDRTGLSVFRTNQIILFKYYMFSTFFF